MITLIVLLLVIPSISIVVFTTVGREPSSPWSDNEWDVAGDLGGDYGGDCDGD